MTKEQAIKIRSCFANGVEFKKLHTEETNILADELNSAIKKQIPQKAIKDEYHHNCCPNCGWIISYDEGWGEKYVPHCENCGQALDWSEENGNK